MSTTAQPAFPEQDYHVLLTSAYLPALFSKVASYGINLNSEADKANAVELAAILKEAETKAGSAPGNPFLQEVVNSVRTTVGANNLSHIPTAHDQQIKQAAAQHAADPTIQQAALNIGNYLAQLQQTAA